MQVLCRYIRAIYIHFPHPAYNHRHHVAIECSPLSALLYHQVIAKHRVVDKLPPNSFYAGLVLWHNILVNGTHVCHNGGLLFPFFLFLINYACAHEEPSLSGRRFQGRYRRLPTLEFANCFVSVVCALNGRKVMTWIMKKAKRTMI